MADGNLKIERANWETDEHPDFSIDALFHLDNLEVFEDDKLRAEAQATVRGNAYLQAMHAGDRLTALRHWKGWEYFVVEFEKMIKERRNIPRGQLYEKYGRGVAKKTLIGKARAERQIQIAEDSIAPIEGELTVDERIASHERDVLGMSDEELRHKAHWFRDGKRLDRDYRKLDTPRVKTIEELINWARSADDSTFFAICAGVEYMAEEAGNYLNSSSKFNALFGRDGSSWMKLHDPSEHTTRDARTTHLGGDLDIARATAPLNDEGEEQIEYLQTVIRTTIRAFELGTNDSQETLAPILK